MDVHGSRLELLPASLFIKRDIRNRLKEALVSIPLSLGLAFLVWFVGEVLFQRDLDFTVAWRNFYLLIFGLSTFIWLYTLRRMWVQCRRRKVPLRLVQEAHAMGLHKKEEYPYWTNDDLEMRVANRRQMAVVKLLLATATVTTRR